MPRPSPHFPLSGQPAALWLVIVHNQTIIRQRSGDWRSWLARQHDTLEVTGSSPVSPIVAAFIRHKKVTENPPTSPAPPSIPPPPPSPRAGFFLPAPTLAL